jgi:hypothetical protein
MESRHKIMMMMWKGDYLGENQWGGEGESTEGWIRSKYVTYIFTYIELGSTIKLIKYCLKSRGVGGGLREYNRWCETCSKYIVWSTTVEYHNETPLYN